MTETLNAQRSTLNASSSSKRGWINCFYRYHKGKKLGPYYVRRWKLHGKLYKEYIKPSEVDKVKAECQRHREAKKQITRWLNNTVSNLNYIDRMIKWSEQGRMRPEDHAFIDRIEKEGYDIDGRPSLRKKIVRHYATYNGEEVILKTVFELDGTSKTFMVPFFNNRFAIRLQSVFESLEDAAKTVCNEIFGPTTSNSPPNPWLQPAF